VYCFESTFGDNNKQGFVASSFDRSEPIQVLWDEMCGNNPSSEEVLIKSIQSAVLSVRSEHDVCYMYYEHAS
jgi:hypothetical protein